MSTTPLDFNLPPKFASWYAGQYEAVLYAVSSPTRFTIINAPTGVGKSAIYMAVGSILGGRTAICTGTKLLQVQLETDFTPMGLVKIMGQSNYPCLYFEDHVNPGRRLPGCDDGPCHAGVECALRHGGCRYYDRVRASIRQPSVAFNYRYWMTSNRYAEPGTLGQFDNLILDEAHDAADHLADFVQIRLDFDDIRKLLEVDYPRIATIDEWVDWATHDALPRCRARLESAKGAANLHHHGIRVVRRLREMETRLFDLSMAQSWQRTDSPEPSPWIPGSSTDWIVEESPTHVVFSPVWASAYAERYLFNGIPRIILLSATITERNAVYLGIPKTAYSFRAFPSPFKKEIRPIIVIPGASVSRNMSAGEERMWINKIDSIVEFEGNVKGIIHAISYPRAKLIKNNSRYSSIMLVHDRRSIREVIEKFKSMPPPAILVSPSVETGYDFPYDQARYQIIAKIPFIDSRGAITQARAKSDRRYLDHVAMVRLIQMAGRGVRSATDFCRCWIIDDNWSRWFFPRNRRLVPPWFRSAIRRVRSLSDVARTDRYTRRVKP